MALRLSAVGNALVIGGSVVGVGAVVAVATGAEITLTPAIMQLLLYKGLAAAALGLIIVGSWVGRRGRRQEREGVQDQISHPELEAGAQIGDPIVDRRTQLGMRSGQEDAK